MSRRIFSVIGKNFGDEGKGLATNLLASSFCSSEKEGALTNASSAYGNASILGIRHNGGAQSGHTVCHNGHRVVWHELSSATPAGADTFWADTYYPDLYKLADEIQLAQQLCARPIKVRADAATHITLIDDILINMALEQSRGLGRHGSCGMGIYEATLRDAAGFALSLRDIASMSGESLYATLCRIRNDYSFARLRDLSLTPDKMDSYNDLIHDNNVLANFSETILRNLEFVNIVDNLPAFAANYQNIIFEGGQGLLLDADCERFSPHVTASKTGLCNVCHVANRANLTEPIEAFYVTRSYVTRHGAGPLPCECERTKIGPITNDETNVTNPWQGSIRYAPHESLEEFVNPVKRDLESCKHEVRATLLVTHLNETDGCVVLHDQRIAIDEFKKLPVIADTFDKVLCSYSETDMQ